ncbi:hypothetical protein ABZ917_23785 [Nonomuraea wenchangensis]
MDVVDHADWAYLAKNGTDATTTCLTIARAATGRSVVLVARAARPEGQRLREPRLPATAYAPSASLCSYLCRLTPLSLALGGAGRSCRG